MDAISTAGAGLMAASARLDASARRLAGAGEASDYVREAVEQVEAQHAFKANVQVVKAADAMWRALLEIQNRPPPSP